MVNLRPEQQDVDDRLFSHRSSPGSLSSSFQGTAAWLRGLEASLEFIDPAEPPTPPTKRRRILREVDGNSLSLSQRPRPQHLMSGSPRKQQMRETHASKMDGIQSVRRSARNDKGARSAAIVPMRGRIIAPVDDTNTPPRTEELDSTSEYDAVSEAPSFPPPTVPSTKARSPTRSSSPKKRTVAKREDLALMSPTIEFCALREAEHWGIKLPQPVKDLWHRCDARRSTPPGTNPPLLLTPKDESRINDTLQDVFDMAETWRSTTTESHWMSVVVGPILHLIRKLSAFQGRAKSSNENIAVMDITPVEISPPYLCPYSTTSLYLDLDKRIDYAIGLYPSLRALRTLRDSTYNTVTKSINQTSTFCNFIPMFVNVEVKRRHVGKDPAIQLGAWIASEFRKRIIEGWTDTKAGDMQGSLSLGSPVFAIEIEADAWLLYVVAAQLKPPKTHHLSEAASESNKENGPDQAFEMFFFGPMRLGDTYSMDDTKRLVENLCDICLWGQTEFRTWWEQTVLAACEK